MKSKVTKAQATFLNSRSRGVAFVAGLGSGKTYVHCIRAIMSAVKGRHYCFVSFSYPTLRDVALVTLKGILDEWGFNPNDHYIFNKTEMSFDFLQTGGKILLRSGDRPDSLRGLNLNDFGIDEAREFKDDSIFKVMLGRLRRSSDATWCITSTPLGKNWIYDLVTADDVELITQSTWSNPFLPIEYIEELKKRYTSEFARQELEGAFVTFGAGIVKPDWFLYDDHLMKGDAVRFWDIAVGTKDHNDFSAGGKLCRDSSQRFQIQDVIKHKLQWPELKREIIKTAHLDGVDVPVILENAGQQAALFDDLCREPEMNAYQIKCERPNGSKMSRLMSWASRLERGQITIYRESWNKMFVDEAIAFTADDSHAHDDMIDSISGAWQALSTPSFFVGGA